MFFFQIPSNGHSVPGVIPGTTPYSTKEKRVTTGRVSGV
ncbi:hypothetical protein ANCDUO_19518 [Ancylostoma duodenale]|uniref:Uncharacterized protein n=1 Tax=Ancylostoma duodenale TaxID=51022 RepID=A0A0C2C2E0_9BILA|nr:hypothetical protein ANCDUO_19518 [Ancylostoma duodenale]